MAVTEFTTYGKPAQWAYDDLTGDDCTECGKPLLHTERGFMCTRGHVVYSKAQQVEHAALMQRCRDTAFKGTTRPGNADRTIRTVCAVSVSLVVVLLTFRVVYDLVSQAI